MSLIRENSELSALGNGRSPDANKIYQKYLDVYAYINQLIHNLDIKNQFATGADREKYLSERQALIALQAGELYSSYQTAYTSGTIEGFTKTAAAIEAKADAIAGGGGESPKDRIAKDVQQAEGIEKSLQDQIGANQKEIAALTKELSDLEKEIEDLQSKISALPDSDPRKAKDQKELDQAKAMEKSLEDKLGKAKSDETKLESDLAGVDSQLKSLEDLGKLTNPTKNDADEADALLKEIQTAQTTFDQDQTTFTKDLPTEDAIDALKSALALIEADFDPKKAIAKDEAAAEKLVNDAKEALQKEKSLLESLQSQLSAQEAEIQKLQKEIDQLPDSDPRKKADQAKLDAAEKLYDTIKGQIAKASSDVDALQDGLTKAQADLASLQELANLPSPTDADKTKADGYLASIQSFVAQGSGFPKDIPSNSEFSDLKTMLDAIEKDLHPTPPPPTTGGETSYFDLGAMGKYIGDFVDYSKTPPVFDTAKFEDYMSKIMEQMKKAGIDQINVSFSQLSTIEMFLTNNYSTSTADPIVSNMKNLIDQGVQFPKDAKGNPGNFLGYISDAAEKEGMKFGLSVGGALAQSSAPWDPSDLGKDSEAQAASLAQLMNTYDISTLDVDYESDDLLNPGLPALFKNLHKDLEGTGRKMTLTMEAHPPKKSGGNSGFFYDEDGKSIFRSMFDGVNIMAYQNGGPDRPYYLNPGLMNALIQATGGDPSILNIGFQDAVSYDDPKNNYYPEWPPGGQDPTKFDPTIKPGSSPGSAAAQLYEQLIEDMIKDGFLKKGQTLGHPFWWPDENYQKDNNRYDPDPSNPLPPHTDPKVDPNFWLPSNDEQDFYDYLHGKGLI